MGLRKSERNLPEETRAPLSLQEHRSQRQKQKAPDSHYHGYKHQKPPGGYLRGFRVPLHDSVLDQFDQRGDIVKLRLLQDTLNQEESQ